MINAMIIIGILAGFAWWELWLLLDYIFLPRKKAMKKCLIYEDKAIRHIFSMFSAYRGFRIHAESRLKVALPPRYLVVANHQSLLDIPIVMKVLPHGARARFVAKQELAWGIPLISLLLRSSGHCLVKRKGDMLQAMRSIKTMARRCKREGTVPVIFPEGTRSRTGELGVFHSAGYRKILETDHLPILVIAIDGGWRVSKLHDFFASFGKTPYTVKLLEILKAPMNKKEALEALERSRAIIEKSLKE